MDDTSQFVSSSCEIWADTGLWGASCTISFSYPPLKYRNDVKFKDGQRLKQWNIQNWQLLPGWIAQEALRNQFWFKWINVTLVIETRKMCFSVFTREYWRICLDQISTQCEKSSNLFSFFSKQWVVIVFLPICCIPQFDSEVKKTSTAGRKRRLSRPRINHRFTKTNMPLFFFLLYN